MNQTDYVRSLHTDVRYRVAFTVEHGQVLDFVVQLEVVVGQQWKPVIRYDTAHGFAHCDRYAPDGTVHRHEVLPVGSFGEALTLATRNVRTQWEDLSRPFREKP
jgi:hypothetical protein